VDTDRPADMPAACIQWPGRTTLSRSILTTNLNPKHVRPALQVLQKIMGDPDLAMAFSNPNVQRAVVDISANPMNIVNYQNDPDVMKARPCAPRRIFSSHAFGPCTRQFGSGVIYRIRAAGSRA